MSGLQYTSVFASSFYLLEDHRIHSIIISLKNQCKGNNNSSLFIFLFGELYIEENVMFNQIDPSQFPSIVASQAINCVAYLHGWLG